MTKRIQDGYINVLTNRAGDANVAKVVCLVWLLVGEPIVDRRSKIEDQTRMLCSRVQVLARGGWIPLLALQAYRPWSTKVKKKEKKNSLLVI